MRAGKWPGQETIRLLMQSIDESEWVWSWRECDQRDKCTKKLLPDLKKFCWSAFTDRLPFALFSFDRCPNSRIAPHKYAHSFDLRPIIHEFKLIRWVTSVEWRLNKQNMHEIEGESIEISTRNLLQTIWEYKYQSQIGRLDRRVEKHESAFRSAHTRLFSI